MNAWRIATAMLLTGIALGVPQEGAKPSGAEDAESDVRVLLESGPREQCLDVLLVGDGYVASDLAPEGRYLRDAQRIADWLLELEPFSWYRKSTNVRAVLLESKQAGCDRGDEDEVDTALDATLMPDKGACVSFRNRELLRELLQKTGGADLALVFVNCDATAAGGSGLPEENGRLFPAPTLSARDEESFRMAMHALGHSLALLCDEFEREVRFCPPFDAGGLLQGGPNVYPESAGISAREGAPWMHFRRVPGGKKHDWLEEGAGRRPKGSYRPWKKCLMRSPEAPFCPVCSEEIAKAIQRLCRQPWDDDAFHRAHPLTGWKR